MDGTIDKRRKNENNENCIVGAQQDGDRGVYCESQSGSIVTMIFGDPTNAEVASPIRSMHSLT